MTSSHELELANDIKFLEDFLAKVDDNHPHYQLDPSSSPGNHTSRIARTAEISCSAVVRKETKDVRKVPRSAKNCNFDVKFRRNFDGSWHHSVKISYDALRGKRKKKSAKPRGGFSSLDTKRLDIYVDEDDNGAYESTVSPSISPMENIFSERTSVECISQGGNVDGQLRGRSVTGARLTRTATAKSRETQNAVRAFHPFLKDYNSNSRGVYQFFLRKDEGIGGGVRLPKKPPPRPRPRERVQSRLYIKPAKHRIDKLAVVS